MASLRNTRVIWLLLLCGSLVLVCLPRFNRHTIDLSSMTGGRQPSYRVNTDSTQYVLLTRFFRNQAVEEELQSPYTYRPVVPFLASLLPFEPLTAINLVDLGALLVALLFLYKILDRLELGFSLCMAGCGLFVFSFPTFYYGTIGYVDPVLVAFLMMGLYYILTERWAIFALVFATGTLAKETIFVLLPVLAAYLIQQRKPWKEQLLLLSLLCLAFVAISYFARALSPDQKPYGWLPSFDYLLFNAARPRCWISSVLSFGIPGFLSLTIFLDRKRWPFRETFHRLGPFMVGFLTTVAVFGYSMFSVYLDGRYIWISYPFSIPLAAVVLRQLLQEGKLRPERLTLKIPLKLP